MAHRTQGNTCTGLFYKKNMITDTDEQPDEEIHRAGSGRVPSSGASVSWSWDVPPSQHVTMSTNLEALRSPYLGTLWRVHRVGMIDY